MAFIGKNVIENLTTAMYENLLIVYREYIQNSADSIDTAIKLGLVDKNKAEIYIDIDTSKRYVSIEDNGVGIRANAFVKVMSSIADSTKDSSENKGFRGIGRLGGISACKKLKFSCSAFGEDTQSIVIWDAQKVKDILIDNEQNLDAATLVDNVTTYYQESCDKSLHFFKVEMLDIDKSANELLDIELITKYLSSVAPLPYAVGFIFQSKIHDFMKENGFDIDEYNVFVNGTRLYKEYTTKLYNDKNGKKEAYDEIVDVKFEKFYNSKGSILAWMWYGVSRFEKSIPAVNVMRGIRLRKGNIQIGNELTFSSHEFYKEPRGYSYFVGEVFAIDSELRPNARRDYFNLNDCCREFEKQLRDLFFNRFYTIYHHANQVKKAYQKRQDLAKTEKEYDEKIASGFVSQEDKETLEDKIDKLKNEVAEADEKIELRNSKDKKDDVLVRV